MTYLAKTLGFAALLSLTLLALLFLAGQEWMRGGQLLLSLMILGYGIRSWWQIGLTLRGSAAILIGLAMSAEAASVLLLGPDPARAAMLALVAAAGGVMFFISTLKERQRGRVSSPGQ